MTSPPTSSPPFRSRPRSSPIMHDPPSLKCDAADHRPIPVPRRLSGNAANLLRGRKSSLTCNSPNASPTRFPPRTPLSFLSNSPTSAISRASNRSSVSSIGWQLRTPGTSANSASGLPAPSPNDSPLADTILLDKYKWNRSPAHVKPIGAAPYRRRCADIDDLSSEIHDPPSPLDKLDHLHSIPPSPPIVIPSAQLLELRPNNDPDSNAQYSIASPFVNLNSGPSPAAAKPGPVSPISPVLASRRQRPHRRSSALANELNRLDMLDNDDGSERNTVAPVHKRDPGVPLPNPATKS